MLKIKTNFRCTQENQNGEEQKRVFLNKKGSIIASLSVFIIGMLALTAMAIDYAMMTSYKRSVQNVSEMMAIAAMGYHTDENFDKKVSALVANAYPSLQQQHWAKTTLGLRNAYLVWNSTANSLAKSNKFANPFGSVNWSDKYETMMGDINADGDIDANPLATGYSSSKVRFLQKVAGTPPLVEPGDISAVSDPLLIRAVKDDVSTLSGGTPISTFFAKIFGTSAFNIAVSTYAEVVNVGKTNSVILLIDRSISMAGKTGDATYIQPGQSEYNERYPGLSSSDLTAIQDSSKTIQPMTDILYAALVVPKILGRSNWFNDNTAKNSSLGLVAFDLAPESIDGRSSPHLDYSTGAGTDNYGNAYITIQNRINARLPLLGRIGLPELQDLCLPENASNCRDCTTAGCVSACDPVNDEIFYSVAEAKCVADRYYPCGYTFPTLPPSNYPKLPLPATELNNFFPWTLSNEGQGLEIAIELIRQEKKRFCDNVLGATCSTDLDKKFQGQIILFSDGLVNAFNDRDYVADYFPQKCNNDGSVTVCAFCDARGFQTHNVREFGPNPPNPPDPVDPGLGLSVLQDQFIPAAWRADLDGNQNPSLSIGYLSCGNLGPCPELYHNGSNQLYAPLVAGGTMNPLTTPSPDGVHNSSLFRSTFQQLDYDLCPGDACESVNVGHEHKHEGGDTVRKPGIELFCSELHFMDYVDWAYANGIIINSVGFGDIGSAFVGGSLDPGNLNIGNSMRRQFLLRYATDPNNYDNNSSNNTTTDKGFFLTSLDVTCGQSGTGCPKFESALKRAFTNHEARLR